LDIVEVGSLRKVFPLFLKIDILGVEVEVPKNSGSKFSS
jgi:hypothetical protein